MKKLITVVGARPQFIKAAAMSRVLAGRYDEIIIHTGQHFDRNMSDIFFSELGIPAPKYNLGISGGSHGAMTGAMLEGIEKLLISEAPDAVLLYGDTNSTLAGALAAVKLHIPAFHIESGNRLGTLDNPEEVNRIAADHFSVLRFCATESAMKFLERENLGNHSFVVGDVMYDAFLYFSGKAPASPVLADCATGKPVEVAGDYCYMTCHRAENTSTDEPIMEIFKAVDALGHQVIYPVHPRNKERVIRILREHKFPNIDIVEPVGYLASIALVRGAREIVTDSGGLQREAFFAGVQCVTVFDHVVWPETMIANRNQLAAPNAADISAKLAAPQHIDPAYLPFGDGRACEKIVAEIDRFFAGR